MGYPLGVDVGTTYTAAALWRDGRVQTVPLGNRANAVPSVLFLREDGTMLVGEAAARRGIGDPDRVAREFKRRMGDEVPILVGGQGFTPQQLSGEVLRWAVERVSELQGGSPQHVVLTHPASWGEFRRNLLVEAAVAAGLHDVGLLAEPVAAATWYAAQERVEPGSLIGIYDFGGGTFDASVVRKTQTGVELFGAAGGDDSIGGVDFDHALFRHVAAAARIDMDATLRDPAGASALGQLFASVVEAKEALSADLDVVLPVVLPGVSQQVLVTRAEFEEMIRPQVVGTVGVFGQVVQRAGVEPTALHAVLLVGGSSRIPLVRQLLSAELGIRVAVDAHPKYTVSLGAAIAAAPRVANVSAPGVVTPGPVAPSGFAPGPVRPMPPPPRQAPQPVAPQVPQPAAPLVPHTPTPTPPSPVWQQPVAPWVPQPQVPVAATYSAPPAALQPAASPGPAPAVSEVVDLARTGLTAATDVQAVLDAMRPAMSALSAPPRAGGPAVVRTTDRSTRAASGRGRLIALAVVLVIVGVVAAVVLFTPNRPSDNDNSATGQLPGGPSVASEPVAGTFDLTGTLVSEPDGADTMRAVIMLPSGGLLTVGGSADMRPRAWLSKKDGSLAPAQLPADDKGQLADAVATPSGALVAVGFAGAGPTRRAAVWTSANGAQWQLIPPQADFQAGSGITELVAITLTGDGKLLALGKDTRTDRADGDAVAFTSSDGKAWTRIPATGLDGSGPQNMKHLIRSKDGTLIAVGSALRGAREGPAIWSSKDGVGWLASPYVPDASATLYAITQLPDGRLTTCGSIGSSDRPAVACWIQSEQQRWERWNLTTKADPTPLYLYGLTAANDHLVLTGIGKSGTTADAAFWLATPRA